MTCIATPTNASLWLMEATAYGALPATPSGYNIDIANWGTGTSRNLVPNPLLRGRRDSSRPLRGNLTVAGNFDHPLNLESSGWLFKHLLGDPVTTGASAPYTHVFTVKALPVNGLAFELRNTDISVFRQYLGIKLNTFSINFGTEGPCLMNIGWIGSDLSDPTGATVVTTPVTYSTTEVVDYFTCVLEIPNATPIATVTAMSLEYSNSMITNLFTIGGAGKITCAPEDEAMLTGTITAFFADSTLLQSAIDNDETSIRVQLTNIAGDTIEWLIQEIVWEVSDPPVGSSGTPITIDLPFRAYFHDAGVDKTLLQVTLINSVASY